MAGAYTCHRPVTANQRQLKNYFDRSCDYFACSLHRQPCWRTGAERYRHHQAQHHGCAGQNMSRTERAPPEISLPIPSTVPHPHTAQSREIDKIRIMGLIISVHTTKRRVKIPTNRRILASFWDSSTLCYAQYG